MSTFVLLCSFFSKYGIHSLPAILLVNQTSRFKYHGPNNLLSLLEFYKRKTGKHIPILVCKYTMYYLKATFFPQVKCKKLQ